MRKTRPGKMPRSGHVIIARVQFADSGEVKLRPAVVLLKNWETLS